MRIVFVILSLIFSFFSYALTLGIEQNDVLQATLKGKRIALVVNQTSQHNGVHLVDKLLGMDLNVHVIFSPEHGFRGTADAGASIANGVDEKSGISIFSLYGATKKPTTEALEGVDVIVFDIQDVGARFYTYISTMHYAMEAAAEQGIEFVVLDRPNPNIAHVAGPVLDSTFKSFVGMHPIPVLHGMTVGELAKMIQGEGWINQADKLKLTVVAMKEYSDAVRYSLPVPPSPNLPNDVAVRLYPSLCFFEGTAVSVGRGTDFPFQLFGHSEITLGDFNITPEPNVGASRPKLQGHALHAVDLRNEQSEGLNLTWLVNAQQAFAKSKVVFFTSPSFFDKLAGTDKLRLGIEAGKDANALALMWQGELEQFLVRRSPYLLYPRTYNPRDSI